MTEERGVAFPPVTLAVLSLVVLAQVPAAPVAAYPAEGAPRDIYTSVSVSAATPDVRRAVFEFRRIDAGYDCTVTNACPAARTTAPFNTLSPSIADGRWCFRARYENDAGTSPFSDERCFLEDNLDPVGPVSVDAGFSGGQLTLAYVVTDEPEVDASGISKCCAGAVAFSAGRTGARRSSCAPTHRGSSCATRCSTRMGSRARTATS